MSENEIKENKTNKNNNEENNKLNRSTSKKKLTTILDFENNPILENKINSPRSLKSINNLNILLSVVMLHVGILSENINKKIIN